MLDKYGRPFKIYSIICLINGKRLISGSDLPHNHLKEPVWYNRGFWGTTYGSLWRTEPAIKKHLRNLCHDWERRWDHSFYPTMEDYTWTVTVSPAPDWERLETLLVEETTVTQYRVSEIQAKDFMGVLEAAA